ncbi:MAG: hypothetical protein WCP20_15715 [Desulfuromonadales bacterium]
MRHDHTDWLIHFVRDRLPEQDFPGDEDAADFYVGGELDFEAPAFSVLKTIIRLGGLITGYSFRSGRTSIYGGKPDVCATEMPIYSFADSLHSGENLTLMSLKIKLHIAGQGQRHYVRSKHTINTS